MARRVRYGIIGFGRFAGRVIAPAIQAAAGSVLVALQKRSLAAAREAAAQVGAAHAFDTAEALVRHPDVDAVFVCSANAAHAGEVIAAARAGKHVIVEKPMAVSVREAEAMMEACDRSGVRLMVGHMVRLSPAVERVRALVRGGEFGPVVFARADFSYDSRQSTRTWLLDASVAGGGPLYDIGVHCLDTLRYVLDDEVDSVKAHLVPPPTPELTETTAHLSLRFSRGTPASIFCTYAAPHRSRLLEVICRDAVLTLPEFTVSGTTAALTVQRGQGGEPAETWIERLATPNLYVDEVARFSGALLEGHPAPLDGTNGLANMRVLEEARRQCQT